MLTGAVGRKENDKINKIEIHNSLYESKLPHLENKLKFLWNYEYLLHIVKIEGDCLGPWLRKSNTTHIKCKESSNWLFSISGLISIYLCKRLLNLNCISPFHIAQFFL